MSNQRDLVGAIFFGSAAAFCACLTLWPRLWVFISVTPRATAQQLEERKKPLRIITALGTLSGVVMALGSYFGQF